MGRVRPGAAEVRQRGARHECNPNGHPVIKLDGVTKVFFTDEVETHALSGRAPRDRARRVRLDRRARRAAASRRCSRSSACSTRRPSGKYALNGKPARVADARRARAHPQPRDRLHLPELQPDRRPLGLRERRAAADLPRHARARAQEARPGVAREGRHGAPHEALPVAALGRPAAARRRRARDRGHAAHPARRRADRKPRLGQRRGGHGPAPGPPPRRRDDLHGHARPALRQARRPHDPPLRRPRRRGGEGRGARALGGGAQGERIPGAADERRSLQDLRYARADSLAKTPASRRRDRDPRARDRRQHRDLQPDGCGRAASPAGRRAAGGARGRGAARPPPTPGTARSATRRRRASRVWPPGGSAR